MEETIADVIRKCKREINAPISHQKRFIKCLYEHGLDT
jgi:hypothetical protein